MNTDAELLRRYVELRSEAAFAELVQRHLNLVYFAALRQVSGDDHRARDVAQTVFTDLARKAAALASHSTLTGWLHTSTRFAAAKARRADSSRQHHEQEATTMNALLSDSDPAAEWERLRPMIDDVIHELDDRDREAVLLRFFEGRPFAEIGATLKLSDDAARMRVERALEKLRAALARRGVNSTGAALAAVFANQVGATAPSGLAGAITSTALAGASGAAAAAGTGFIMNNTSTAIVSAVALIAIGSTFFQWNHAQRAEAELAVLTLDRDGVRALLRAEQQRATRSAQDVITLRDEVAALKAKAVVQRSAPVARSPTPVPVQEAPPPAATLEQVRRSSINKAILNNLRVLSAAVDRFNLEQGRPPTSIQELVGEGKYIRAFVPVNGEDYTPLLTLSHQPLSITDSDGERLVYDPSAPKPPERAPTPAEQRANELGNKINAAVNKALAAYRAANGGAFPAGPQALIPFFATPQEGADFVEALEAQKAAGGK